MQKKSWFMASVFSFLTVMSVGLPKAQAQGYSRAPLDDLKYVDIRDLLKYGTDLSGTSNLLMKTLESNPQLLLGENTSHISFHRSGAQGPQGSNINQDGKSIFNFADSNDGSRTRQNTVLGAEFERIVVEDIHRGLEAAQVFSFQMILFVHDDYRAEGRSADDYYFRRLNVKVDWTIPPERAEKRVQVLNVIDEIPLSQTQFQIAGDLLERKVIMEDPVNNIVKVFPIGVGSFDVRTAYGMDNNVSLMTYEFENATLKKTSTERSVLPNTRSRIYPSYYRGRPFLAIYDQELGYRQIGLHYQIDGGGLRRGFVSHGCIRVEDMYLYQLDAILNEGVHDELPIKMVYDLKGYEDITHPMPKMDSSYGIVNYSELRPPNGGKWNTVECKHSNYRVRYYGDIYHTVADSDCLTKVSTRQGSVYEVIDYLKGRTSFMPMAYVSMDNHVPVSQQNDFSGEVEAGNADSEVESFEEFKRRTSNNNRGFGIRNILPGRQDQDKAQAREYLSTYCRNKSITDSRNCRKAMQERLKGSAGLY